MMTSLQQREIFHLEFLRALIRVIRPEHYALKGGTNLRLFFGSPRYSEDMDIDVRGITVSLLQEKVMRIIQSQTLKTVLSPFNIREIVSPDIEKAKQTMTVQRFKVHLITTAGEDLFTKIEFSRRGFDPLLSQEMVRSEVTRFYKVAPLIVSHYELETAVFQKIRALVDRKQVQARDVLDLFVLHNRFEIEGTRISIPKEKLKTANENLFSITFEQFCNTALAYLSEEDQQSFGSKSCWDEIRLQISVFIEKLIKLHG